MIIIMDLRAFSYVLQICKYSSLGFHTRSRINSLVGVRHFYGEFNDVKQYWDLCGQHLVPHSCAVN